MTPRKNSKDSPITELSFNLNYLAHFSNEEFDTFLASIQQSKTLNTLYIANFNLSQLEKLSTMPHFEDRLDKLLTAVEKLPIAIHCENDSLRINHTNQLYTRLEAALTYHQALKKMDAIRKDAQAGTLAENQIWEVKQTLNRCYEYNEEKLTASLQETIKAIEPTYPDYAIALMQAIPVNSPASWQALLKIFNYSFNQTIKSDKNTWQAFFTGLYAATEGEEVDDAFIMFCSTQHNIIIPDKDLNNLRAVLQAIKTNTSLRVTFFKLMIPDEEMEKIILFIAAKNQTHKKNPTNAQVINDIFQQGVATLLNSPKKDAENFFSSETINAVSLLNEFKQEALKKENKRRAYKDSIHTFYVKGIDILLSDIKPAKKEQALKNLANKQFHHKNHHPRLLKDALMVISFIFLGAGLFYGLYRKYHDKTTFFFSTETTKRHTKLNEKLKQQFKPNK